MRVSNYSEMMPILQTNTDAEDALKLNIRICKIRIRLEEKRLALLRKKLQQLSEGDWIASALGRLVTRAMPPGKSTVFCDTKEVFGLARQFRKARDLVVWQGLVPAEHSTGGKETLLRIRQNTTIQ